MADRQVADRLQRVRDAMAAACARAGRPAGSVRLVAVSKYVDPDLIVAACRCGQWDLGESRVQDALLRQETLATLLTAAGLDPSRVVWHFIGHLQGNKAGRATGRFALMHGIDSVALAERIARHSAAAGRIQPLLLEVNISGESRKHGLDPAAAGEAAAAVAALPGLELRGLMGMARQGEQGPKLAATFALLRRTAEAARQASGLALPELSMGMSDDFEVAIAEGATIVRVGSAIFSPGPD